MSRCAKSKEGIYQKYGYRNNAVHRAMRAQAGLKNCPDKYNKSDIKAHTRDIRGIK